MRYSCLIFSALLTVILFSCSTVHEFPDCKKEPADIAVSLDIVLKQGMPEHKVIVKGVMLAMQEENASKYDRRFIIEIRNSSTEDLVDRRIVTRAADIDAALRVELALKTIKYRMYVWTDFVLKGTTDDLYYNLGNGLSLDAVHIPSAEEYVAGTDFKDTQVHSSEVDLTPYEGQNSAHTTVTLNCSRPMAKITFLASDLEDYARSIGSTLPYAELASRISVEASYAAFFPSGYNLYTDRLNDAETGYGYTESAFYPILREQVNYTMVGSDYVFVNGDESSVTVSFSIKDRSGKILNSLTGLAVPTAKGKETIVIGKFFTGNYNQGVGIDPAFDGEFNIEY